MLCLHATTALPLSLCFVKLTNQVTLFFFRIKRLHARLFAFVGFFLAYVPVLINPSQTGAPAHSENMYSILSRSHRLDPCLQLIHALPTHQRFFFSWLHYTVILLLISQTSLLLAFGTGNLPGDSKHSFHLRKLGLCILYH